MKPDIRKPSRRPNKGHKPMNPHSLKGDMDDTKIEKFGSNDKVWYNRTPELVDSSAKLPSNVSTGNKVSLGTDYSGDSGVNVTISQQRTPGIVVIDYVRSVGVTDSNAGGTDAINLAASFIYNSLRRWNSGSNVYEKPDVMLMLASTGDILGDLSEAKRALRLSQTPSNVNKYTLRTLVNAAGFEYDDIITNMAHYKTRINSLIRMLDSAVAIPDGFPFMRRWAWMADNVFTDEPSSKAQFYLYRSAGYWIYSPTTSQTGGQLTFTPHVRTFQFSGVQSSLETLDVFLDSIQTRIQALIDDTDIGYMVGDIRRAYEGQLLGLNLFELSEQPLLYDEEVLSQIENVFLMNPSILTSFSTYDFNVTQANGQLVSKPYVQAAYSSSTNSDSGYKIWKKFGEVGKIINMHKDNPDPLEVMVASRMVPAFTVTYPTVSSASYIKATVTACGTEIPIGLNIVYQPTAAGDSTYVCAYICDSIQRDNAVFGQRGLLTNFHRHPTTYVFQYIASGALNLDFQYLFGDADVTLIASDYNISQLHKIALLSEFGVPGIKPGTIK